MRYFLSGFAGLAFGATLVVGATTVATPAKADPYRWCADFGGGRGGGGTSCYYTSFEQCRQELIGRGGACRPNPFYDGRPVMTDGYQRRTRNRAERY